MQLRTQILGRIGKSRLCPRGGPALEVGVGEGEALEDVIVDCLQEIFVRGGQAGPLPRKVVVKIRGVVVVALRKGRS